MGLGRLEGLELVLKVFEEGLKLSWVWGLVKLFEAWWFRGVSVFGRCYSIPLIRIGFLLILSLVLLPIILIIIVLILLMILIITISLIPFTLFLWPLVNFSFLPIFPTFFQNIISPFTLAFYLLHFSIRQVTFAQTFITFLEKIILILTWLLIIDKTVFETAFGLGCHLVMKMSSSFSKLM